MQEREIRLLFEKGHFTTAQIVPDQEAQGWNILLRGESDEHIPEILSAKRGGPRTFKTTDAAIAWCHEIGLKTVTFKLEDSLMGHRVSSPITCDSILLVEDNEDDVLLTLRAFQKRNLHERIVVKRDGREALDFLFSTADTPSTGENALPCLILLDLKLPKLDGFDVLREIRNKASTRLLPVIILSSSQETRDVVRGYDLGTNSYLRKPTTQDNFEDMVGLIEEYWLHLNVPPYTHCLM